MRTVEIEPSTSLVHLTPVVSCCETVLITKKNNSRPYVRRQKN